MDPRALTTACCERWSGGHDVAADTADADVSISLAGEISEI